MKIRSLLLGSVAAAGLATTGFAADLGVVTSLDVCDELGLSGLTISSDENCLAITGNVSVEYSIGNYWDVDSPWDDDGVAGPAGELPNEGADYAKFARTPTAGYRVNNDDALLDSSLDIDAWLQFVATSPSDFGPASATIKLLVEDYGATGDPAVLLDQAFVSIGDTTIISAGRKGSIFIDGDDAPLNYLGLFNSSSVDTGVGFSVGGIPGATVNNYPTTGNNVIQIVSEVGNGLKIGGAIENLAGSGGLAASLTGVGVISYAGEGITAHASGAIDTAGLWKVHAGFTGAWDPIKVVGAVAANNGWWNVLGSVEAGFDIFTLAASGEATSAGEWGVGGSAKLAVTEGVTINLGARLFDGVGANDIWQAEAGVAAAVTETIGMTAAIGVVDSALAGADLAVYGKAGLAWAPGGGFTSSIEGEANTLGGYKATFKASKSIK